MSKLKGQFRPRVADFLIKNNRFMSPDEISDALNIEREQARACCQHMWEIGLLKKKITLQTGE